MGSSSTRAIGSIVLPCLYLNVATLHGLVIEVCPSSQTPISTRPNTGAGQASGRSRFRFNRRVMTSQYTG